MPVPEPDQWPELLRGRARGAVVAIKAGGRPHLSNVIAHVDPDRALVRVSITDSRAKTRHLRRDPRASFYVTSDDGWEWWVAEGDVELTPVAAAPDDQAVEELVDLYRSLAGEHQDWDDYRRAMVADGRLVAKLHVTHIYGQPRVR